MSKQITEKTKAIYKFITEKTKKEILDGKTIPPTCYAVSFDDKNEVSVLPIPLADLQSSDERRLLLGEMGKILKKENVKIKMFMSVMEAWMSTIDTKKEDLVYTRPSEDPQKKEALICSGWDCFDNINYQLFEMKRVNNKVVSLDILPEMKDEWRKMVKVENKFKVEDTLLNAIWKEYRDLK